MDLDYPADTFYRVAQTATGNPGTCSDTLHLWRVQAGAFSLAVGASSGTLTATSTPALCLVPVARARWGGMSRTVEADFTDSNYNSGSGLVVHSVYGGTNNGNAITVVFSSTYVLIMINNTQVARSYTALTNGTPYTVSAALTIGPTGGPTRVRVYVNGGKAIDYYLTSAQQATLTQTDNLFPFIEDGLKLQATTTQVAGFRVRPFTTEEPYESSGTATLAAGTATVADARITAASLIRLFRTTAGGTLGELSYSLTAGTGFTIASNSGADTSGVYYEIVSY